MGTATHYDPELTLRDARARYFIDNDFGEQGNYDARWVKLSLGPIPFAFPNSTARVKAVRYHDLHHVLTGYPTTLRGEAEIGAWELASGCGSMVAALILNLMALAIGLVIDRQAMFAAFVRGRYSNNLYGGRLDDALLGQSLGEQRARLGLDRGGVQASAADRVAFVGWSLAGAMTLLAALGLLLAPVVGLVWWLVGTLG